MGTFSISTTTNAVIPYFEVFDMIASVAFYRDILGFEQVFASPEVDTAEGRFSHFVRLRFESSDLFLNTAYDSNERPLVRDEARWRGHSDAALYIECGDVDRLYAQLRERGLAVDPPATTGYGVKAIHLRDPDGYGLHFNMRVGG
jgi:glyoxylase I family protein